MNFEDYLRSKKIDTSAFEASEPSLWQAWKEEFEQLHPNSFTMQKLNLINPIRRKYQLKEEVKALMPETSAEAKNDTTEPAHKPVISKPVIKPKPKIN